jgi:hypothetical protein
LRDIELKVTKAEDCLEKIRQVELVEEIVPEEYQIIAFVVDQDNKVVHLDNIGLAERHHNFNWNGSFSDGTSINSENQYFAYVGIVKNLGDWAENYQGFEFKLNKTPKTSWIGNPTKTSDDHFTFIDLVEDNPIKFDVAYLDWLAVSEEAKLLPVGSDSIERFVNYSEFRNKVKNQGYGIGDVFKKVDNPLQFLYDQTEVVSFLGKDIRVHWKFGEELVQIDNELRKDETSYQEMTSNYEPADYVGGIGVRAMFGSSSNISLHSYGTTIDIYPKSNPYIKKRPQGYTGRDYQGEWELRKLIEISTGLDIFDSEQRTVETITTANQKFKEVFKGKTLDEIAEGFELIQAHIDKGNRLALDKLGEENYYERLVKGIDYLEIYGDSDTLNTLLSEAKELMHLLDEAVPNLISNQLVFRANSSEFIIFQNDLKYMSQIVISENSCDLPEGSTLDKIKNNLDQRSTIISKLAIDFGKFEDVLEVNNSHSLSIFGQNLKLWVNNAFNNNPFDFGFCGVHSKLVNEFLKNPKIQWGGLWNGSNVDFMHFEVPKRKVSSYLKNER